ncbi:hypothetical protein ABZ319_00510 [Nocardia sp. NPDC005978]|uniref:hypothetical protein n=1 Tax=Nocardia sp. NPDC005978 TaxID=3156725 RepID=UPI0033A89E16
MTVFPSDVAGIAVMGSAHRCSPDVVKRKLENANSRGLGNVISVQVEKWPDGMAREDVIRRAVEGLPHKKVLVADTQALYTAGFTLRLEVSNGQQPNHHHVEFADPVTDDMIDAFGRCFSDPEPKPA